MKITPAFVQGDYLFKLVGSGGQQSYIPLTVWDPTSSAAFLVKNDVYTWQAWNPYGGYDFYSGLGSCPSNVYPLCSRARIVSFDRPYGYGEGAGDFLGSEYPFVRFVEEHGLDVTYVTDVTVEQHPKILRYHRVLLSLGHDECWSLGERRAAVAAEAGGINMVLFGASRHLAPRPPAGLPVRSRPGGGRLPGRLGGPAERQGKPSPGHGQHLEQPTGQLVGGRLRRGELHRLRRPRRGDLSFRRRRRSRLDLQGNGPAHRLERARGDLHRPRRVRLRRLPAQPRDPRPLAGPPERRRQRGRLPAGLPRLGHDLLDRRQPAKPVSGTAGPRTGSRRSPRARRRPRRAPPPWWARSRAISSPFSGGALPAATSPPGPTGGRSTGKAPRTARPRRRAARPGEPLWRRRVPALLGEGDRALADVGPDDRTEPVDADALSSHR